MESFNCIYSMANNPHIYLHKGFSSEHAKYFLNTPDFVCFIGAETMHNKILKGRRIGQKMAVNKVSCSANYLHLETSEIGEQKSSGQNKDGLMYNPSSIRKLAHSGNQEKEFKNGAKLASSIQQR